MKKGLGQSTAVTATRPLYAKKRSTQKRPVKGNSEEACRNARRGEDARRPRPDRSRSFAAVANTCNLAEINVAALKKFNEDLEARAAATEAPTMMLSDSIEPTAAPESDAADRVALGAVVALLTLVA